MTTVNSLPFLRRALTFTVVAVLLLAGCASSTAQPAAPPISAETSTGSSVTGSSAAGSSVTGSSVTGSSATGSSAIAPAPPVQVPKVDPLSELAERIEPLPSAIGVPTPAEARLPVALSVPDLEIDRAPIRAVGVEPSGEMEIPAAEEVGWYRFGASPGEAGSAVLAAHVAFDGRDGVFRYLTELAPGATMQIEFADGLVADFIVASKAQYEKDELPFDAIFAREGLPSVALITCGGSFNASLRSYDDNVVAYAIPVAT